MFRLEGARQVRDDAVVKVLATQARVAGGGEDLKGAFFEGEKRYVEGAAAEVVDENGVLAFCLEGGRGVSVWFLREDIDDMPCRCRRRGRLLWARSTRGRR